MRDYMLWHSCALVNYSYLLKTEVRGIQLQAIAAPKLFIGSEDDSTVPLADTQQMFDLSPDPKQLQTYPGSAHGVRLFKTEHGDDLRQRLIAFITANAPPA